jgi:hypothetical protein
MLVAALIASAIVIIIACVLAWTVYKVAEVRKDKASNKDLNRVIDHLNSLSHGIHLANLRAEQRLDSTEGDVRQARDADATLRAKLDELEDDVRAATVKATKASGDADAVALTQTLAKGRLDGLVDVKTFVDSFKTTNADITNSVLTRLKAPSIEAGSIRLKAPPPPAPATGSGTATQPTPTPARDLVLTASGELQLCEQGATSAAAPACKKLQFAP